VHGLLLIPVSILRVFICSAFILKYIFLNNALSFNRQQIANKECSLLYLKKKSIIVIFIQVFISPTPDALPEVKLHYQKDTWYVLILLLFILFLFLFYFYFTIETLKSSRLLLVWRTFLIF
jgi:hypothetical protein